MKKILLIVFGLVFYYFASAQATITYACPMHPEIHADKPGNCPNTTYLCYARKAFFGRGSKKKSDTSSYPESEHNIEPDTKST